MGCHQPTKDYVTRRTAEGKTKTEIMRCLKRYIVFSATREALRKLGDRPARPLRRLLHFALHEHVKRPGP